ncbi:MAG: PHP domain-containing protein [bacterium]|nr:PHP domain-containing protein [bacterium]
MTKVDLHLHSNYSDGSESVQELVNTVKNNGIKIFALTDHDTVIGCSEVYKYLPKDTTFIPGVELTCETEDIKCHILGYNCDTKNEKLLSLIEKGKKLRRIKLDTRIKFLKDKWGIELTQNELDWLYSRKSVVKTHIANILVNRNLATDNVSAMDKYLEGCECGKTKFEIQEAINVILSSGAIPVWAHPLGGEGEKHVSQDEFKQQLKKMINYGIEGLECYYSRYNLKEIDFLIEQAKLNNLLISGGSDYHGTNKSVQIKCLNSLNIDVECNKLTILEKIKPIS